ARAVPAIRAAPAAGGVAEPATGKKEVIRIGPSFPRSPWERTSGRSASRESRHMTRTRYRIHEGHFPYFLTCTLVGWLPVFTLPETKQIVLDSWRFLQDEGPLTLFGYVLLENHLHLIASSPDLPKEIGDFKSFTARRIIDHLEAKGAWLLLKLLQYLKARHK